MLTQLGGKPTPKRGHAEIKGKFTHFARNALILQYFLSYARLA